jgi:hypothetical protein
LAEPLSATRFGNASGIDARVAGALRATEKRRRKFGRQRALAQIRRSLDSFVADQTPPPVTPWFVSGMRYATATSAAYWRGRSARQHHFAARLRANHKHHDTSGALGLSWPLVIQMDEQVFLFSLENADSRGGISLSFCFQPRRLSGVEVIRTATHDGSDGVGGRR